MLGEISDIRKRRVALAYFFPILRRNFVAGITRQLLCDDVRLMRELRVINGGFLGGCDFLLWGTILRTLSWRRRFDRVGDQAWN